MGFVFFNQNAKKGSMVRREEYSTDPQLEWGGSGFKCITSIPERGYVTITSAERAKVYELVQNSEGGISISEHMVWKDEDKFFENYQQNIFTEDFRNARSCGFLSNDGGYIFVFTPSEINYYKYNGNSLDEYALYYTEDISGDGISIIKMAPDTEYSYMLDNNNGRLYTLRSVNDSGKGGLVLQKGSWIDCDVNGADEIEISLSGEFLAIYNSNSTSCINIIKTAR